RIDALARLRYRLIELARGSVGVRGDRRRGSCLGQGAADDLDQLTAEGVVGRERQGDVVAAGQLHDAANLAGTEQHRRGLRDLDDGGLHRVVVEARLQIP